MNKIRSEPKGKELVEKLEESENVHAIEETDTGNSARADSWEGYDGGSGSGSTIEFNPDKKTGGTDSTGSDERPPFVGLGHELGHSEAIDRGKQTRPVPTIKFEPKTTPRWEKHSMRRENQIRREHDLPRRRWYYAP